MADGRMFSQLNFGIVQAIGSSSYSSLSRFPSFSTHVYNILRRLGLTEPRLDGMPLGPTNTSSNYAAFSLLQQLLPLLTTAKNSLLVMICLYTIQSLYLHPVFFW